MNCTISRTGQSGTTLIKTKAASLLAQITIHQSTTWTSSFTGNCHQRQKAHRQSKEQRKVCVGTWSGRVISRWCTPPAVLTETHWLGRPQLQTTPSLSTRTTHTHIPRLKNKHVKLRPSVKTWRWTGTLASSLTTKPSGGRRVPRGLVDAEGRSEVTLSDRNSCRRAQGESHYLLDAGQSTVWRSRHLSGGSQWGPRAHNAEQESRNPGYHKPTEKEREKGGHSGEQTTEEQRVATTRGREGGSPSATYMSVQSSRVLGHSDNAWPWL